MHWYQRMRTLFSLQEFVKWDILDGPLWQRIWVQGDRWSHGKEDRHLYRTKAKARSQEISRVNSKSARTVV